MLDSDYEIIDSKTYEKSVLQHFVLAHLFQIGVIWSDINENPEKCQIFVIRRVNNHQITGLVGISSLRPLPLVQISLAPAILSQIINKIELPDLFIGFGIDPALLDLLRTRIPKLQIQFELFFTYEPNYTDPIQNSAQLHLINPKDESELKIKQLAIEDHERYFQFLGQPASKYANDPRLNNTYILELRNEIIGRMAIESIIDNQIFIQTPLISSNYRGQGLCTYFLKSVVPMLLNNYSKVHVMTFEQDDRAVICITKAGFRNVARFATIDTSGTFVKRQRQKIQK
jgi:RimJ/RimL family protein N-acetyltransferase